MKPLNIDKTGCSNISSNCVVWQGPDIECINLCKGDSITEVVYKLALELCKLIETFDLKNYDLKCFSSGVCQPQNFTDFINILIGKVCALQECNPDCIDSCNPCPTPVTSQTTTTTGDSYVPIAKEFQFKNATGDDVTVLKVSDYAQAIGNKVSTIVNSASILQATVNDHSVRIKALEDAGDPVMELPTVTPIGVLPKVATSMQLVLSATEQQLTELKNAVGDANNINTNLQKLDLGINDLRSLSQPGTNVSSLRGFTAQPTNLADVLGNTFIIIKDMRNALSNLITNFIPGDCESISLDFTATFRAGEQLFLYLNGTLPSLTFENTRGTGTIFTITDNYGTAITYTIDLFNVINLPEGYLIDLSNSRLNTSSNLTITANPSFTHKTTGSECQRALNYTVINQAICPGVAYTPTDTTIGFNFSTSGIMQAYTVKVYNSAGTDLLQTQTFVSNAVQQLSGTFTGLTSSTLYKLRVEIVVNNVTSLCEFTSVTTI